MKWPSEKDFYSVLGVKPGSTDEAIRNAYLSRSRVLHPDRFDPKTQWQEWEKANEMLAELNEAYAILRNPQARKEYDAWRSSKSQSQATPQQPTYELGEMTSGCASYSDLPNHIQEKLRKRQKNKDEDQLQFKLASVAWNYVFILLLLCSFSYLFANAEGPKWDEETLFLHALIAAAVGILIGRNMVTIRRWAQSTLKPYFYMTPLYFIKTEFDIVSFRPLWELRDVAVTHNYKNGEYRNSIVVLKFDGHNESLFLPSRKKVDEMSAQLQYYGSRIRTESSRGNYSYFRDHDDFFNLSRSGIPANMKLSKTAIYLTYLSTLTISGLVLSIAIAINDKQSQKRLASYLSPTPWPTVESTPRPYIPPKQQIADPYPSPETPLPPEMSLPYNGAIRAFTGEERIAPLTIKAAQGVHFLVKLVDADSTRPVLTVFVRSGDTVRVKVPLGSYQVRYASGEKWYGYKYLFGPETSYSKADKTFEFDVVGEEIRGYTITLYKVIDGNLHTWPIRREEF